MGPGQVRSPPVPRLPSPLSNRKQKSGEGEATKKPEEKGLAVGSRALADALENNLVRESQMPNRRSEVEIVQDAKTNCALDLLSNPHYAINLSLRRKLGKEVDLMRDVRVRRDGGQGGGATAKAVAAAWGPREENRAAVVLITQARRMFKESARGKPKDKENYTPNSMNFSKISGNHHHFSWNDLSECQIDFSQVNRGSYAAAGLSAATPDSVGTIDAFILRTRKRATKKMVDLQTTPRMKMRAGLVRTALTERKPTYMSIIKDIYITLINFLRTTLPTAWSRWTRT